MSRAVWPPGANDTFRQAGVAVGIAALGTLVPAGAALGGNPQAYVDGLHHALIASAVLAIAGAVATAWLLIPCDRPLRPRGRRRPREREQDAPIRHSGLDR